MEGLLSPISTRNISRKEKTDPANVIRRQTASSGNENRSHIGSAEEALALLRSHPDEILLNRVLQWLCTQPEHAEGFSILRPTPFSAQVVAVLVNQTIPNFWPLVKSVNSGRARKTKGHLLTCMRSTAACGAILSQLRLRTAELSKFAQATNVDEDERPGSATLQTLLEFLAQLLNLDDFLLNLRKDLQKNSSTPESSNLLWNETIAVFATGKLLSVTAEAGATLRRLQTGIRSDSWIESGNTYASWLGRNLQTMLESTAEEDIAPVSDISRILKKALLLGYSDTIVHEMFASLRHGDEKFLNRCQLLVSYASSQEQRAILHSLLKGFSDVLEAEKEVQIASVAALINAFSLPATSLDDHLLSWLIGVGAEAALYTRGLRRAVVLAVCSKDGRAEIAFSKALELFAEKLFIKHTPILQQEVNSEVLLLLAGHLARTNRPFLVEMSKSGMHLRGVSNHLSASSPRAKELGMIIGESISEIVDENGKRLSFKFESGEAAHWKSLKSLVKLDDRLGSIKDLALPSQKSQKLEKSRGYSKSGARISSDTNSKALHSSRIVSIEEIEDEPDSSDDDIPTYSKPDSDLEDEDEDPTVIERNKPAPPVYIKDLLSGLRDSENYDRHTLALSNAANLIRRKASFGTELADHLDELASSIAGLKDRWDLSDFTTLKIQSMVALVVASPLRMAQWLSRAFYTGDYSLGQRMSILTALGLGAREIASIARSGDEVKGLSTGDTNFPSKRLPKQLHEQYAVEAAAVNAITSQVSKVMIGPLAASAADKATGPDILKVRTFSSRMDVEKRRGNPTANPLSKIVADGFFYPLTARWQIQTQGMSDHAPQRSPMLLSHLLKTLSLILHASGPSTPSLPQITREFWEFLLSVRLRAETDTAILEALLFSFLTLLELNANRQRSLAEEHSRELLQTQIWAETILGSLHGADEESDRCKTLAAGIVVRSQEIVEKYQRLLVGDMVDFMN